MPYIGEIFKITQRNTCSFWILWYSYPLFYGDFEEKDVKTQMKFMFRIWHPGGYIDTNNYRPGELNSTDAFPLISKNTFKMLYWKRRETPPAFEWGMMSHPFLKNFKPLKYCNRPYISPWAYMNISARFGGPIYDLGLYTTWAYIRTVLTFVA